MSDTETEQQEIQARVQQIFAHNTLPISDTSEVSDLDLSLTHPANPNTYFESFPPRGYPPSSGDSSYSEQYPFGGEDQSESPSGEGTQGVLTPGEVGSRINNAAHKYRVDPGNTIRSLESGHVARRVEMFQDAQNASRGGFSNSSRVDSPFESNVSQLKAKFDLPSTSPLPRKFSQPPSSAPRAGERREDPTPFPPPRANLESLYSAGMSTHCNSFQKFNYTHASPSHLPRSIVRRSKSASPERSGYAPGEDSCGFSSYSQARTEVDFRSRSISPNPKPRPRTRTMDPAPQPIPKEGVEELYARPDTSHKRKRTLSSSSNRSPPKRPSLSFSEDTSRHASIPSSAVFSTSITSHHSTGPSPIQPRSRRISMSPELAISKQLMKTVRRSMSPEDLRQLEAQYGASGPEESSKVTNSLTPLTSPQPVPQNPAPYTRNRSFRSAVTPGKKPGSRPVPTPASVLETSIGFPHRIPRRSETSFSLHTPKGSDDDRTLTMDDSRPVTKSLSTNLTTCSSQTSIDTVSTDISSISSMVPTHCLTFSSGYNIQPAPVPSAPPAPMREHQVMTRAAARSSSDLKERLGALRNQIYLLEDGWRQATSALFICQAHGGLSGSDEEVEAERLLLNCSLRREAFFHEVKLLESGYGTEPLASCTATLTLSGIQLSLNQQFMEHLTTRIGIKFSYHFVCVIRSSHPSQVVATHPLSPQPSVLNPNYNQLVFPDTLVLHCVREGFQLTPMVFLFEASKGKDDSTSQNKTPVGKVKKILNAAKSGSPLRRQKSLKKAKKKLPIVTSETEIVLKKTRFALIASTSVDKRQINRTDFRLEPLSSPVSPYPLIPLLRLTVSASPNLEQQEVVKGFLTIFHDDLTWNRRWCVLAHTTLSYWLYPEEEEQVRPPAGSIDLQSITGEIESTNRIQCARMNTFCFHCGKTRSKKYLISADSKQEKEMWMSAIRQIQTNVRAWV